VVELAPAVGPVVGKGRDARIGEGGSDAFGIVAVGGELGAAGCLGLLEAGRCQLQEARPELLDGLGGRGDRGPDQLKTLFSFSKKPV
jgi:hypothetical protein